MNGVLVAMEQRPRGGHPAWSRMSWEALAAGRELADRLNQPLLAAVAGDALDELKADLAGQQLARAYAVQHALLQPYTADGFTGAFQQLIARLDPAFVVFPHTYQVRDFAGRLAARFGQTLIADVIGLQIEDGTPVFVRQLLQGKLNADYRHSAPDPASSRSRPEHSAPTRSPQAPPKSRSSRPRSSDPRSAASRRSRSGCRSTP